MQSRIMDHVTKYNILSMERYVSKQPDNRKCNIN